MTIHTVAGLSPDERKKLKGAIIELDGSMVRIEAERDLQKNIISELAEEIGLDKKLIRKLAKTYHDADFTKLVEDHNTFEEFYTGAIEGSTQ
jgi:hypothetical protein